MGCIYERRHSPYLWIKYYGVTGRPLYESTGTKNRNIARRILRSREGDVERGVPVTPKSGRVTFDEAVEDLLNDYAINHRKTLSHARRRVKRHLAPIFSGRRLLSITASEVRAFVLSRQQAGAANGEVNRELALLNRLFMLAMQAGKIHAKPHISKLREDNVRKGFFSVEAFTAVRAHLPVNLQPVVTFAYITGWRLTSEILPLEWRTVDWENKVVRLDAGTTKNGEGRSFPFTTALCAVLDRQQEERDRLKAAGTICPYVFHRNGKRIRSFRGAWLSSCEAAGLPGRLLHDFRRTAVRNLELAGVPRSVAMSMVGHKTESVYRRYAIVDGESLRDAASKMNAAVTPAVTVTDRTPSESSLEKVRKFAASR